MKKWKVFVSRVSSCEIWDVRQMISEKAKRVSAKFLQEIKKASTREGSWDFLFSIFSSLPSLQNEEGNFNKLLFILLLLFMEKDKSFIVSFSLLWDLSKLHQRRYFLSSIFWIFSWIFSDFSHTLQVERLKWFRRVKRKKSLSRRKVLIKNPWQGNSQLLVFFPLQALLSTSLTHCCELKVLTFGNYVGIWSLTWFENVKMAIF